MVSRSRKISLGGWGRVEWEDQEHLTNVLADRGDTLGLCEDLLIAHGSNVLLHGERGVGKTFFAKVLCERLSHHEEILPVYFGVGSMSVVYGAGRLNAFTISVLQCVYAEVWCRLLGRDYWDLRDGKKAGTDEEQVISTIFQRLTSIEHQIVQERTNHVGADLIFKGEVGESTGSTTRKMVFIPRDIPQMVDSLRRILRRRGISKIVLLCDEGEHLKIAEQREILQANIDLFTESSMRFLFMAALPLINGAEGLPHGFDHYLKLGGLPTPDDVGEMINKRLEKAGTATRVGHALSGLLYRHFDGHPRLTLLAADHLSSFILGHKPLDLGECDRICVALKMEIEHTALLLGGA